MTRGIAYYLDVPIDPNNPPPAASPYFTKILELVKKSWDKFEEAEATLQPLDDLVNTEILNYVFSHPHVTGREIAKEWARRIDRMYPLRILQANESYPELELAISALEKSAHKEPETVKGQAAFRLDLGVMKNSLAPTREIIQVAQNQLNGVRAGLNSPYGKGSVRDSIQDPKSSCTYLLATCHQ
jgi:hypothetical protein